MKKHIILSLLFASLSSNALSISCLKTPMSELLTYDYIYVGEVVKVSETKEDRTIVENELKMTSILKGNPDSYKVLSPNKKMLTDSTIEKVNHLSYDIKDDFAATIDFGKEYLIFGNYNQKNKRQVCDPIKLYDPNNPFMQVLFNALEGQ